MESRKILIVDDTKNNLDVLMEVLKDQYDISVSMDGETALEIANEELPDLILLDVIMADMDGYEVCEKLKKEPKTRNIPVIFITALSEVGDETRGFSLGAVDYITKPIQPAVVQARVKTHLEMKLNREKLEKQNHELLEAAKLREEVERITRHDLKSPLDTIIGFPELILMQGNLDEEQAENLRLIEEAGRRMLTMINRSLDLFKMEQKFYRFEPQEVNVLKIIRKIYREHTHGFGLKEITPVLTLEGKEADTETFPVWAEELLCYSMLENLIRNALEASPEGKPLSVNISSKPQNTACIAIHNYGVVPAEIRGHFFEKYVTYGKEAGTGLGTYSARLMAETQEGKISFTTHEEQGTTVFVTLRR